MKIPQLKRTACILTNKFLWVEGTGS